MSSSSSLIRSLPLPSIEKMGSRYEHKTHTLGTLSVAALDAHPSCSSYFSFIFSLFWKPVSACEEGEIYVDPKAEKSIRKHLSPTEANDLLNGCCDDKIAHQLRTLQNQVNADRIPRYFQREDSGLPRTLLVTPSGVYLLLNHNRDGRIGSGNYKKVSKAIHFKTGEKAAYYSILVGKPNSNSSYAALEAEFKEMQQSEDISCRPVSGSFSYKPNKKNRRQSKICYLTSKMKGDLFSAKKKGLIDFDHNNVRMNAAKQMATLVAHYNQKGMLHRDLKPDNFLFSIVDGRVVIRLIDFGLAIPKNTRQSKKQPGTPLYMSPEALNGQSKTPDEKNDGWQLGMTLAVLFKDQLDDAFLSSNEVFKDYMSNGPVEIDFWQNMESAAKQWTFEAPLNKHSLEYVIFMLLQVDRKKRWTPAQAALALAQIERKDLKSTE